MSANKTRNTNTEKTTQKQRLQVFSRAEIAGQVLIHNDSHLYIAPLHNISAGGLFVEKLINLSEGATVRVVVRSPKFATPIQAKGNIVRVQKEGRMGLAVEFTSINSHAKEMIQTVIFENKLETALRIA